MAGTIGYLTPFPPHPGGIADYASHFKAAIEHHTEFEMEILPQEAVLGNSVADFRRLNRQVLHWKTSGLLERIAFIHAEVGRHQHAEFYSLFWLSRRMPALPFCVTLHDPPLVVAPMLFPLCLGLDFGPLRLALRVLDYTPIGRNLARSVLRRAQRVFVLSAIGRERLQPLLSNHSGLRILPHIAYRKSLPARSPNSSAGRPVTLLFLGFWHPKKGVEVLVRAFQQVASRTDQPVRLLLAGRAGPGRAEQQFARKIDCLMASYVERGTAELLGYVAPENLDAIFDSADIFVVPYTRQYAYSSSAVLHRAMASGTAIVASDIPALREELQPGETALLVPPEDPGALAKAILELAANPELRLRLGQRAQARIAAEHSCVHVADSAALEYQRIATSPSNSSKEGRTPIKRGSE